MENFFEIKDQIIKNGFWNIITGLINRLGGLILVVFLSRLLLPEGFGRYSLAMTVSLFFITFSDMVINQTLIRYVSLKIGENNNEAAAYFRYLFKIKFFIILFLSLILFISAYPLSNYLFKDPSLFLPFIILSFYVFIISLTTFFESLFFIKKNVRYISVKESISLFIKIIIIFIIGYFVSPQFKLIGIFLSFVIISFFLLFFIFYFSKKTYPFLFKKIGGAINKKEISKFILLLNIQNISLVLLSQSTIILLGVYLTKEYIGYYNSSLTLVLGISTILFSLSYILLPIFTNLEEQKFQYILKKTFRISFILAIPISFGLSILSKYFISMIYGYNYLPAHISLSILSFLIPCILGIELSLTSFSARNKQKKFSLLMFISAITLIVLNYVFIKIFLATSAQNVVTGASFANLITWFFCFIFSILLLKKEFNIQVISFWIIKPLLSSIIMYVSISFIMRYIGEMDLLKGIMIILLGMLTYLSVLLLMGGIEKAELEGILKTLKFNQR